jgi:hypothetical protein
MRYEQNFKHKLYEFLTIIASLSPRRPGFDSRPFHVRFVIDRVTLGQVFLRIFQFLPVSIISLILHIQSQLNSPLLSEGRVDDGCDLEGTIFLLSVLKELQVRWQDFFVRRCPVLVCQPNTLYKLYLKTLHLLHLVVSEMNCFVFVSC